MNQTLKLLAEKLGEEGNALVMIWLWEELKNMHNTCMAVALSVALTLLKD